MSFRDDLDAAKAREDSLARELAAAKRHAEELRERTRGEAPVTSPPTRPTPAPVAWWRSRKLRWASGPVLLVVAVFVGLPAFANATAAGCGYKRAVLAAVEACPAATALLGDDVRFGYVGLACGSSSSGDGPDRASWRMPIVGDRGSGVIRFNAVDLGTGWVLTQGTLSVDDHSVDLTTCLGDQGRATAEGPSASLQRACDDGDARACRDLSVLYETGNAVEKNLEKADQLRAQACRLGLATACAIPQPAERVP